MKFEKLASVIVNESGNLVYLSDPETYELLYLNQAARDLFGVPRDADISGAKCYQLLQGKDAPCEFCTNRLLSTDSFYTWYHYNKTLGSYFVLRDKLVNVDGRCVRMEIATDITEKEEDSHQLAKRLSVAETLLRCVNTLKSGAHVDVAINDLLSHIGDFYRAERAYIFEIDYVNQLVTNTYEWCLEGVEPQIDNLREVPLEATDRWIEAFKKSGCIMISSLGKTVDHESLEYQILEPQGIDRLIAAPLLDEKGNIEGFIGIDNPTENFESAQLLTSISYLVMDDLEKRTMLSQLERMSYEDTLTGVGNRNCYFKRLSELTPPLDAPLGVVYADINGLKRTNDTYGHSHGDALITRAAIHLKQIFGKDIYRIGGDEFVVICADTDRPSFEALVEKLRDAVDSDDQCNVSIGAKWSSGGDDYSVSDLVTDADELMYINKQSYYKTSMASMPRHRAMFVKELVKAINDGTYVVLLQPKVDLKNKSIYGAEALIRRKEADGRLVTPTKFIFMLEAEGAIRYIDFFVLETVCKTLRDWKRCGLPLIQMAVNFSRITLMEHNVVESMLKVCRTYDIDPRLITVEVTESIGRMDIQALKNLIVQMVDAGFSISLDDFGSQYSNLAILATIDFDELKFDKTLIDNIATNEKSSVIIRHAIDMGKTLNCTSSVAEGIETPEQLSLLEDMDCDYGQGYLFSAPIPIDQFQTMLRETGLSWQNGVT